MRFELGKTYRHSGGRIIKIVGLAKTCAWGMALVAEEPDGSLVPIGWDDDSYAENWVETDHE